MSLLSVPAAETQAALPAGARAQLSSGAGHGLRGFGGLQFWKCGITAEQRLNMEELEKLGAARAWGGKIHQVLWAPLLLLWVCVCPTRGEQFSLETILEQKNNQMLTCLTNPMYSWIVTLLAEKFFNEWVWLLQRKSTT